MFYQLLGYTLMSMMRYLNFEILIRMKLNLSKEKEKFCSKVGNKKLNKILDVQLV